MFETQTAHSPVKIPDAIHKLIYKKKLLWHQISTFQCVCWDMPWTNFNKIPRKSLTEPNRTEGCGCTEGPRHHQTVPRDAPYQTSKTELNRTEGCDAPRAQDTTKLYRGMRRTGGPKQNQTVPKAVTYRESKTPPNCTEGCAVPDVQNRTKPYRRL